jgi:hypothetical protein
VSPGTSSVDARIETKPNRHSRSGELAHVTTWSGVLHQDAPGIPAASEDGDHFGYSAALGDANRGRGLVREELVFRDFDGKVRQELVVSALSENDGVGLVTVLTATTQGVGGAGSSRCCAHSRC